MLPSARGTLARNRHSRDADGAAAPACPEPAWRCIIFAAPPYWTSSCSIPSSPPPLYRFAARRAGALRRAALRLDRESDRRQPTLARLRPDLRVRISLPDAGDALHLRAVRLAESRAQGREDFPAGPPAAHRRAVRARRGPVDAAGVLSGLSRHRDRSELAGVLVALDRAAVLAGRAEVVLVVPPGPEPDRCRSPPVR